MPSWNQWNIDAATAGTLDRLIAEDGPAESRWRRGSALLAPSVPFDAHRTLYESIYGARSLQEHPRAAWFPDESTIERATISRWLDELDLQDVKSLHRWSVLHRDAFWQRILEDNQIRFRAPYRQVRDPGSPVTAPVWFPGAAINIAESCFGSGREGRVAITYEDEAGHHVEWTTDQLLDLVQRIAGALESSGFRPGQAAAIVMPMTPQSVAIYLGIIWAGGAVIGVADSFAPPAIATRLELGAATVVFTAADYRRGERTIELYRRLLAIDAPPCIIVGDQSLERPEDRRFASWLEGAEPRCEAAACEPMATTNILFSSGTTGEPKAIPWNHTTPIKCLADARLHHDIQADDTVAWPTNLGWMMGPWLIYASLIPGARMALFGGNPGSAEFIRFVERTRVTMLGVIPSLVRSWRASRVLEGADWSAIRCFSTTGECSQAEDMLYLMSRAGYRPIIEYCGGTEIGGGYISATVVQPSAPSLFTTPAMGLDLRILDDDGHPADQGEVFIVPPSIGLSVTLLNRDHDAEYFADTPRDDDGTPLRRHGDAIERLADGNYRILGRADDAMNLGGIKVAAAEIERVVVEVDGIREAAAVAMPPPEGGPEQLHLFAVADPDCSPKQLEDDVRRAIRERLNPLFKLAELIVVDALPRTASNKVMRRVLRDELRARRGSGD